MENRTDYNLKELRYLVNSLCLTENLQLLPYIQKLIFKIAWEEDCIELLCKENDNG